ncbi:MAG TPA: hypothetical protein VLL76_08145 [Candidatus Omnitrophota bacterium]|nr:hypothetical protein [Candidatus Omnitrophota bacterium]
MNKAFYPALGLLAFSIAWTGGLTAMPRDGKPVAAIYPPDFSGDSAFRHVIAAGAEAILGIGGSNTVVLARSESPAFIDNLYASGALVVLRVPERGECLQ